jgi:hypothetical protein
MSTPLNVQFDDRRQVRLLGRGCCHDYWMLQCGMGGKSLKPMFEVGNGGF